MKISASARKTGWSQVVACSFTEPEMDAALQLIQLSGDSSGYKDQEEGCNKTSTGDTVEMKEQSEYKENGNRDAAAESQGDTEDISSPPVVAVVVRDKLEIEEEEEEEEAWPRRKRKFRYMVDLYRSTKPLILVQLHPNKKAKYQKRR